MEHDLQEMNHFIQSLVEGLNQIPYDMLDRDISQKLNILKSAIERAGKEFNANLFLILAFGPVKSGKSTLINILAREKEVSPTEFGIECTLRPSIIIKAKGTPRICRYISRSSSYDAEMEKENFNLVLDYIRGITSREEILSRVLIEEYPLSIERLQKFLAGKHADYSDLGTEPLITVIEVEANGSRLIDEHTAIVDVPGLDGMYANWRNSPVQEWILTRSDFLLFIQSSIAALNAETIQFLKEVYINSKEPPMQLVQNIIEAKHWLGQEYLMKEAKKQRDKGMEEITKLIPIAKNRHFDSSQVNLGKAHDAIFGIASADLGGLYKASGMDGLETKLYHLLCTRREDIMWSNSQKGLRNTLEKCLTDISALSSEENRRYLELEGLKDRINKARTAINTLKTNTARELVAVLDNRRLEEFLNEITDRYFRIFKALFQDNYPAGEDGAGTRKETIYEYRNTLKKLLETRLFTYDSSVSQDVIQDLNDIIFRNISQCINSFPADVREVLDSGMHIDATRYKYMINGRDFGSIFTSLSFDTISRPRKLPLPKPQTPQEYEMIFHKDCNSIVEESLQSIREKMAVFLEKSWRNTIERFETDFMDSQSDFNSTYQNACEQHDILTNTLPFYESRIREGIRTINQEM